MKPPCVIFFVPRRRLADCYIFHSIYQAARPFFLISHYLLSKLPIIVGVLCYTEFQQSERPLSPADIRLHNEYHITLLRVVLDKKKNTCSDIKPEQKLHSQPAWEADGELNF